MLLRAWALGIHALVAGIGFFAIGLPVTLVLASHPGVEDSLRAAAYRSPVALGVGALAVAVFYALPLLWPLHIAVALYESGLVARVRRGEIAARRAARRILALQSVPFMLIATALAVWFRFRWWSPSLVPLGWGTGHLVLAWWMTATPRAEAEAAP